MLRHYDLNEILFQKFPYLQLFGDSKFKPRKQVDHQSQAVNVFPKQ